MLIFHVCGEGRWEASFGQCLVMTLQRFRCLTAGYIGLCMLLARIVARKVLNSPMQHGVSGEPFSFFSFVNINKLKFTNRDTLEQIDIARLLMDKYADVGSLTSFEYISIFIRLRRQCRHLVYHWVHMTLSQPFPTEKLRVCWVLRGMVPLSI